MFSLKSSLTAVSSLYIICTVVVCPLFAPCRGGYEGHDYDPAAQTDAADATGDAAPSVDATDTGGPDGDIPQPDGSPKDANTE